MPQTGSFAIVLLLAETRRPGARGPGPLARSSRRRSWSSPAGRRPSWTVLPSESRMIGTHMLPTSPDEPCWALARQPQRGAHEPEWQRREVVRVQVERGHGAGTHDSG